MRSSAESVPAGSVDVPGELSPAGLASTTAVGRAVRPTEVGRIDGSRIAGRAGVVVDRATRPAA